MPEDSLAFTHFGQPPMKTTTTTELAKELWGVDKKDTTWECMYAIHNFRECSLPWVLASKELGYKDNFFPRGLLIFDAENEKHAQLKAFLDRIGEGKPLHEAPSAAGACDDLQQHASPQDGDEAAAKPASSPISVISWSSEASIDGADETAETLARIVKKEDPSGDLTSELWEGEKKIYLTTRYERNRKIVKLVKQKRGHSCEVCGFDFGKTYGEVGEAYIQVHHLKPISSVGRSQPDLKNDFAVVCANCHVMIHRRAELVSIAAMRAFVSERTAANKKIKIEEGSVEET